MIINFINGGGGGDTPKNAQNFALVNSLSEVKNAEDGVIATVRSQINNKQFARCTFDFKTVCDYIAEHWEEHNDPNMGGDMVFDIWEGFQTEIYSYYGNDEGGLRYRYEHQDISYIPTDKTEYTKLNNTYYEADVWFRFIPTGQVLKWIDRPEEGYVDTYGLDFIVDVTTNEKAKERGGFENFMTDPNTFKVWYGDVAPTKGFEYIAYADLPQEIKDATTPAKTPSHTFKMIDGKWILWDEAIDVTSIWGGKDDTITDEMKQDLLKHCYEVSSGKKIGSTPKFVAMGEYNKYMQSTLIDAYGSQMIIYYLNQSNGQTFYSFFGQEDWGWQCYTLLGDMYDKELISRDKINNNLFSYDEDTDTLKINAL